MRPPKPPRLTSSSDELAAVDSSTESDAVAGPAPAVAAPVTVSLMCSEPDIGLGFDVSADQTGAVFVRDVFEHGPATQTGKIRPGEATD